LSVLPLSIVLNTDDPNQSYQQYVDLFTYVLQKNALLRKLRVKPRIQPNWMNSEILHAIKQRNYFHKKMLYS